MTRKGLVYKSIISLCSKLMCTTKGNIKIAVSGIRIADVIRWNTQWAVPSLISFEKKPLTNFVTNAISLSNLYIR